MKLSVMASLAVAATAVNAAPTNDQRPFNVIAVTGSQSPINLKAIAGHDGTLQIYGDNKIACDLTKSQAALRKPTALRKQADNVYMALPVTSDQLVFVGEKGRVGYTAPGDSTGPEGAHFRGFTYELEASGSGKMTWKGENFAACEGSESGDYEVFAASMAPAGKGCIDFVMATQVTSPVDTGA